MPSDTNPFELRHRERRALALTLVLHRAARELGMPVETVLLRAGERTWTLLAEQAQITPPSSKTRARVGELVLGRAA